jgi:hypothetical protein
VGETGRKSSFALGAAKGSLISIRFFFLAFVPGLILARVAATGSAETLISEGNGGGCLFAGGIIGDEILSGGLLLPDGDLAMRNDKWFATTGKAPA